MHFSAKTDIEAPAEVVFAALSDFEGWERAAMRRGGEVHRTDKLRSMGPGVTWNLKFRFRGRERALDLALVAMEPGAKLGFTGKGKLIDGALALDLVSLAPKRTRLVLELDVGAVTLGARLMLQSLKLARGRVQRQLDQRMVTLARDIELRYAATKPR